MVDKLLSRIESPADLKALDIDQLPQLALEMREAICEQVSKSGGHLAPNLGVVELTIALHYVFDFGHDRLLFDVGHQCYPHKLLTGRAHLLPKLRQAGGMAGFPEPSESKYDLFSVGHAGTAISTAVGLARGDALQGQGDRRVVSLIGDASIVNGVAMEGLNNAGTLGRQFLVVLNDNGMSIAKPQGAMARYFDRMLVHSRFGDLVTRGKAVLRRLPASGALEDLSHRATEAVKAAVHPEHMFSQFGLQCLGPIDGHDLPTLISMLNAVKDSEQPILLHCKTVKGKGFDFASGDPTAFHSPKPFTVEGCRVEVKSGGRSFTSAFADAMVDLMNRDDKIFAVSAAMPDGTGVAKLIEQFPQRTLDTGICESHAMDMCAGMAKAGMKPFFAVYSTFSQRALDQVFQEVALQGLAVRVCMDRAGYVGGDGAVHHGFMDVSMFRSFPKAALIAASDEVTLRAGLEFMRTYDDGPSFTRYPRDSVATEPLEAETAPYELGKAHLVRPAQTGTTTLAVLAYGTTVYDAKKAMDLLGDDARGIALYDARFAKPVDIKLIASLTEAGIPILTIEEHARIGGFGAAVLEACNDEGLPTHHISRLAMPDQWIYQDSRGNQLAQAGLDPESIAARMREILMADHEVVPTARPRPTDARVQV